MYENKDLLKFTKYLSNCINTETKTFHNKELILGLSSLTKQIGYIKTGKAVIIKIDINGNKTIIRDLNENDIFSNLFFQSSEDEVYVECNNNKTEVTFIDYYTIIKNCSRNCPFHNNFLLTLFDLIIEDNKKHYEKIELLSKNSVKEKILFFLKKRASTNNIFKVTTSYKAIAEYICVDRSNFMRELKNMEKEKLIKKDGKTITIL